MPTRSALSCRSGDHPALHSFPTRRSSDLNGATATLGSTAAPSVSHCAPGSPSAATGRKSLSSARRSHETLRSEEHTSELQSRRDLVCRLLLEKKKERRSEGAALLEVRRGT